MSGFRFIHAADLHLDSPFAGLSAVPEEIAGTLRQSTFRALERLVELAVTHRVDFVLVAGDVYESADRSLRAQFRFHKAMQRLAENGISAFVVHGNHDPSDGREARLKWPEAVHIFGTGAVERIPVVLPGRGHVADVLGISYPAAAVSDNYALSYSRSGSAPYQIGLLHANVDGAADHANYAPCSLRDLLAAGMDYWALGHIHGRRVLHEVPYIVFPGNIQGRSVRETGEKGCYMVDVDEHGGTSLVFHPLDAVRWVSREVSIAGLQTEQELREALERCLEEARQEADGRPVVVRLALTGRGTLHRRLADNFVKELADELRTGELERAGISGDGYGIEEASAGNWVWIEKLSVHTGSAVNRELLIQEPGFLGDVLRLAGQIGQDPVELRRFAAQCLEPLFQHPKAGSLLRKAGLTADGEAAPHEALSSEWLERASEYLLSQLLEDKEEGR